jgi:hypothetical protein
MACSPERHDQIAAFGHGRLDTEAAGELLVHVADCRACSDEFDAVADLLAARAAIAARCAPARPLPFRRFVALAATAAAAVLVLLLWQPWRATDSVRGLANLTPLAAPESLLRGDPGERGAEFSRGMAAYGAADWAAAVQALRSVVAERPTDALAHLYLGIAELQRAAFAHAEAPLTVAAQRGTGLVAERGLWYLANAHLHQQRPAEARAALEQLRALDGDYALNADELLRRLAGN